MQSKKEASEKPRSRKRSYVKQADVPLASLEDALRIPKAIIENYAGDPTSPLKLAKALDIDPKGSQLKILCGAAIAYGLTEGGAQAASVSITELASKILRPLEEGAQVEGRREAILKPRVFGEFLRKYDQNALPRRDIARNVLVDMGVPEARADEVLDRLEACAESAGFIVKIKGKRHIDLSGVPSVLEPAESSINTESEEVPKKSATITPSVMPPAASASAAREAERAKRVFIAHGKDLIEPIRKLLEYGELQAVVAAERQSVSKPVPDKVMADMRNCGAAIIHVDVESQMKDSSGRDHVVLNPNVLIEIGAAMAFYGRRFILLVREGISLPSNLQGLYEVRYGGSTLDASSTIQLLEAIKDIKNYPLPPLPEADGS